MKSNGYIDFEGEIEPSHSLTQNITGGVVTAFLLWMRLWVSGLWRVEMVNEYEAEEDPSLVSYITNRHQYRCSVKALSPHRYSYYAFRKLLPRHLSKGQFAECCARMTIYGRRRFYLILNWLKHLSRTLQVLICGRVKQPSSFTALELSSGGLWDVHLWPS